MVNISRLQLLLPILNILFFKIKDKNLSKNKINLQINKFIILDNFIFIVSIIILFLTKNLFLVNVIVYVYVSILYIYLKYITKDMNKYFILDIVITEIAMLILLIAINLFVMLLILISIILLFNLFNSIYPIVINYSVFNYIPLDLIITLIILFIIRCFLLIKIIKRSDEIHIVSNKHIFKYLLVCLVSIGTIYFSYNYYITNNIFKYILVTNKFVKNQELYYLNGEEVKDINNYEQTSITEIKITRNYIDYFFENKVNDYTLSIIQKIYYNNKIYELKFEYIYFSSINDYSDAGYININENNVLNVDINTKDNNINPKEIKDVFNQGLKTINTNILNKIYQKQNRFNDQYLGNFNQIFTKVNATDNQELYNLVNNIVK